MLAFHKNKNTILNTEWSLFKGGFLHIGQMNWVFAQCFAKCGQAFLGTEKDFIFRAEFALDHERKFSIFTLELVNLFEARWVYLWFRVWPGHNLKFVFNFGWRLTRASREYIERQAMEQMRRMERKMEQVQANGVGMKKVVI